MRTLVLLTVVLTVSLSEPVVLAEEVGHYSFDEGSGTTIHDSSPSANHGSLSSSSLWSSPGYDGTGHCIQLPGYSGTGYASIPHTNLQNFDGMIYLSAWVNPQPSGNALDPVLVKGSSSVPYGLNIYNGKLWFQGNYLTGGTYFEAQSQGTVSYGQWSQVGVAYDQKNVTFYINGQKAGQTPMTVPIVNNSQPMYVGIDFPGYTEKYKGRIDEVVINNTAGFTPLPHPRTDPTPPPAPTGKKNLIVFAHGAWTADGGSPPWWVDPDGYKTHVQPVVDAINQRLNDLGIADQWEVYSHPWFEGSWPILPWEFFKNAKEEGMALGSRLGEHGYEHIHLIGHSAGCALVGKAAEHIKDKSKDTVIHSTFLDPFVMTSKDSYLYGGASDWSDHYFATGDWPLTEAILPNAYNVDVTALDDEDRSKKWLWENHMWPLTFYRRTTNNTLPDIIQDKYGFVRDKYGFVRSLEGGGWSDRVDYPLGDKKILGGGTGVETKIIERNDPAIDFSSAPHVTSDTGTVNITGTGFSFLTGSPVWMTAFIETAEPVNFLTFEAYFTSEPGAEGLLAVYWNYEGMGLFDERFVLDGMQEYTLLLPKTFQAGTYALSFRLDPYTEVASSVLIDNVQTGYATVIPEPLTMLGVSMGVLGLVGYIRKRK